MSTITNVNNASNASNFASSDPTKPAEVVDDSMDVDEPPTSSTGRYKVATVPGQPNRIAGLEFDDSFEEEEAEMSSDSEDDDEDNDDGEEIQPVKISAAVLLDKPIEETDDAEDEDYVPTE